MTAISLAQIEGRTLFPLSMLISGAKLPADLPLAPGDGPALLDEVYFTDAALIVSGQSFRARLIVVLETGIDFAPLGDTVHLVLGARTGLTGVAVGVAVQPENGTAAFEVKIEEVPVSLWVSGAILRPVKTGTREPDETRPDTEISLGSIGVRFGSNVSEGIELTGETQVAIPRSIVGTTGVLVEANNVLLRLSSSVELPAGAAALGLSSDWRGLYLGEVRVWLPEGLSKIVPDQISLTNCFIGEGGISGSASVDWSPAFSADLFGITVALEHLGVTLALNQLTELDLRGALTLPVLTDANGDPAPIPFVIEVGPSGYRVVAGNIPPLKLGGMELDLDGMAVGFDATALTEVSIGGVLRIPGLKGQDGRDAEIGVDVDYAAGIYTVQASSFPPLDLGPFALALDSIDVSFNEAGLRSSELAGTLIIPGLEAAGGGPARIAVKIGAGTDDFALTVSALPPLKLGALEIHLDTFSLEFGKNTALAADIAGKLKIPNAEDAAGNPVMIGFGVEVDSQLLRIATTAVPAFKIAGITVQLSTFSIGFDKLGVVAAETTIEGTVRVPAFKNSAGGPLDIAIAVDLGDGFGVTAEVPGGGLEVLDIADTIRIALSKLSVGVGAQGVRFSVGGRIDNGLTVPILEKFLPSSITVNDLSFRAPDDVKLDIAITMPSGLTAGSSGDGGFEVDVPIGEIGAGVSLDSLHLAFGDANPGYQLEVVFRGATLKLGPVVGMVDGLGLGATIKPEPNGNLGPSQIDFGFIPPKGFGLSLKTLGVKGGGYLYLDYEKHEYAGVGQLEISGGYGLTAVGILNTRLPGDEEGFSLLLIVCLTLGGGIAIGFGFFLAGLGGLLGVNRDYQEDEIRRGISDGTIDSILFPPNPVDNARKVVADVKRVFPPAQDKFVIGLMARITWGQPRLITCDLGLIVALPDVVITLIGRLRLDLPDPNDPVLALKVTFQGTLSFPKRRLTFDATVAGSRLLTFALTGQMGMLLKWGEGATFAMSVGGYHPKFQPPPELAITERMGIAIFNEKDLRLRLGTYLAITTNTLQLGVELDFYFAKELGPIGKLEIQAGAGFDVLIQLKPFHFIVSTHGHVTVARNGAPLAALTLRVSIEGPGRWIIDGEVFLKFLVWEVREPIHEEFGDEPPEPLPPARNVEELVLQEVAKAACWTAALPERSESSLMFRDVAGETKLVLHPFGTLSVRQRVAPLGISLAKFGESSIEGEPRIDFVEVLVSGLARQGAAATDLFARGPFFAHPDGATDDQKAQEPQFETFSCGVQGIGGTGYTASSLGQTDTFGHETLVIDDPVLPAARATGVVSALTLEEASTRAASARLAGERLMDRMVDRRVRVTEPQYVAMAADGADLGGAAAATRAGFSEAQNAAVRAPGARRQRVIPEWDIP